MASIPVSIHPRARPGNDLALGDFPLEGGATLPRASLRYRIFGEAARGRANGWILVFHDVTGSADVDLWWAPLLGPGLPLDTSRFAVVCANLLGSCYGSTGPTDWPAARDRAFPDIGPVDLARAHLRLLDHLGARRVMLATGGGLGGMVALEWARLTPVPADRLVVLAAPAVTSPQVIAWNAAQRMAIEAGGPSGGLAAARALATITERSAPEFAARFGRGSGGVGGAHGNGMAGSRFDVEQYLRQHGQRLIERFDAASYLALLRTVDLHDLGDLDAAARATAQRVGEIIGVGINTDMLIPPSEVRSWVHAYQEAGAGAAYRELTSIYGHDAYLIEHEQVGALLARR